MSDMVCPPSVQSSAGWTILLLFAPSNAVHIAAIAFSTIIIMARIVNVFRPKSLNARIGIAFRGVEENVADAEGRQLLDRSNTYEIALPIEEKLKRYAPHLLVANMALTDVGVHR